MYGIGERWNRLQELEALAGLTHEANRPAKSQVRAGAENGGKTGGGTSLSEAKGVVDAPDVGQIANLPTVRQVGNLPHEPATPFVLEGVPPTIAGWLRPQAATFNQPTANGAQTASQPAQRRRRTAPAQPVSPPAAETIPAKLLQRPHFVFRPLEMGLVVAISSRGPFSDIEFPWRWLFNTVGESRWNWRSRHGVSLFQENGDFWKFLVPGVGLAPVVSFEVLITLFALAIGPINYLLLRRWKRLHLLVVTVPLGAAAVTFALFGYALLTDGLGTRLRVRSLTRIDQHRGEAITWARLSYYSGLSPRGGLEFPDDVMVVPCDPFPGDRSQRVKMMAWTDSQRMSSGWINPRTPTQYLTVRVRAANLGLKIEPASDTVKIENHLAARIEHLVVRTKEGAYFGADDVAADATATLVPLAARRRAACKGFAATTSLPTRRASTGRCCRRREVTTATGAAPVTRPPLPRKPTGWR